MVKVTKVQFFALNRDGEPERLSSTLTCPSGKIYVEWQMWNDVMCAEVKINSLDVDPYYFTGRYLKRVKFYFDDGYVWDTLLKQDDEWRWMIYQELKRYIDSGYEDLPGKPQSELSRAARLLDDDMIYEI